MDWNIFTKDGERFSLYDLHAWPDSFTSCKVEHFLADGTLAAVTGVAERDDWAIDRNSDGWWHNQLARFGYPDEEWIVALLDYLLDVGRGVLDPAVTPPRCPAGGRVEAVLCEVEDHTHE